MYILRLFQTIPDPRVAFTMLLINVGGFLFAITFHEFAHAYIAYRNGDPTAKMEGRLSLNPMSHIDFTGAMMFFLIGFGWAKPVPYNPNYLHKKSDELKVAIAGIVANLILALLLSVPLRIANINHQLVDDHLYLQIFSYLADINIMLAAFNLIPIPPLDGSHFIEYFLDEERKYTYRQYGQYLLLGLVFFDILTGSSVIFTIMQPLIRIFSLLVKGTFVSF